MAQLMFDDLPKGDAPLKFDDLPNSEQKGDSLTGAVKAIGSGIAKGVADIPSDFIGLGNLVRKIDPLNLPGMVQQQVAVPGILQKLSQAADASYTPQGPIESGLKTAAQYAPAVATGPEGLMSKGALGVPKILASRAIRQAAIPAAVAAGADKAAEGTPLEPYAGPVAGMIAGGLAGGKTASPVRTSDEATAAAKGFSDAYKAAPITINANKLSDTVKNIQNVLKGPGVGIYRGTPIESTLEPYLNNGNAVPLAALQDTRSLLAGERGAKGAAGTAATIATRMWDEMMNGLAPSDTTLGGQYLPQAMSDLRDMRAAHAVRKQMELVEDKGLRAENRTLSTYSADNGDNVIRQNMASLRNRQEPSLQPYDQDMLNIIKGNALVNTMRRLGNVGHGLGSFLIPLGFMDAGLTGGLATSGAVAGGVLLKRLAGASTRAKYEALLNKIGSNAPGVAPLPASDSVIRKLSNAARGAYVGQQSTP